MKNVKVSIYTTINKDLYKKVKILAVEKETYINAILENALKMYIKECDDINE